MKMLNLVLNCIFDDGVVLFAMEKDVATSSEQSPLSSVALSGNGA